MTNPEDIHLENERSLQTLVRAIRLSQGEFSLILVRCNYANLRERMVQRLRKISPVTIREMTLPASVRTLYTTILDELGDEHPPALMVFGLEAVKEIDKVLTSTKYVREEFRKNCPFPMLLWVNDQVIQKINRLATDFANWATRVEFALTADELVQFLRQKTDEIFASDIYPSPENCWELETARQDLQNRGQVLEPAVHASLEFIFGLNYYLYDQIDSALEHYQPSLAFWQQSYHLERQGKLLLYIALAYYRKAEHNHTNNQRYWKETRKYLQQCLDIFEQAQRPDLVAQHISKLGEVLRRLQAWEELQTLVQKSLQLHQHYGNPLQLAQDYGFLAEVALEQSRWNEANQLAQQALKILDKISNLEPHYRGWYQYILARSQQNLGQIPEAVNNLEKAREQSNPQYDPQLYIAILGTLRAMYYEQGQYLEAFRIKQEQLSIEQQYGFRAFIGAAHLNPQRQAINPAIKQVEKQETVAQEIVASGRQQDVKKLIERISGTEHKLTVIYGQSGVGKTSILRAGLIPTLLEQSIGERDVLPIFLRNYTDWVRFLGQCLIESFEKIRGNKLSTGLDSIEAILKQLQKYNEINLVTVLIFDQFEDFFFAYTNQEKRRPFYDFLRICLDIPFVNVILSLKEDYLHYLLEWERLLDVPAINTDILRSTNRYYLSNLSIENTKLLIQSLTKKAYFLFDSLLIDELVNNLADETGEVRPIELQIVGAQLQTDKITTVEKYRQVGSKEKLVKRFLEEVLRDCGSSNESAAELVLYLLTNANGTRPIKTYAELRTGLASQSDKLDLVLEILVKSGLVTLLPELYIKRYQLVHDYLVDLIRQKIEFPIKEKIFEQKSNKQNKEEVTSEPRGQQPKASQETKSSKLTSNWLNQFLDRLLNTKSLIAIFLLILLAYSPLRHKDKIALGVLAIGWGIAASTAFDNRRQRERIRHQIQDQKETISLLQSLLREGGNYSTGITNATQPEPDRLLNNRYKVKELLGAGGFSYTYRAEDTHLPGKPMCVVKHLQPARNDAVFLEVARRLFKTEAEILELLGYHPQIPRLTAYFEENQQFYLVQDYIFGHNLQVEFGYDKRWSEAQVVDFLKDVLQILVFVHSRGVIHRDIKPSNLMRRESDQRIVLIDFGAVKQIHPQLSQQDNNPLTVAVGTVGYAPPEQFMGQPRLNSDIYALGMIAIQAITGTPATQLQRDASARLIWREFAKNVTEELANILDKMVIYDFYRRYQSAEEVLQDFELLANR